MSNYPAVPASCSSPDKLSVNNSPATTVLPPSQLSTRTLGLRNFLFLPGRRGAPAASLDLPGQHLTSHHLSLSLSLLLSGTGSGNILARLARPALGQFSVILGWWRGGTLNIFININILRKYFNGKYYRNILTHWPPHLTLLNDDHQHLSGCCLLVPPSPLSVAF